MIEFVPAPDHVFAARLSGTLTPDDVERAVREIEAKLQRHKKIGIFADVTGFQDVTAEALIKDFKYSFGKFGEWTRFPREAVVTQKQWLRTAIKLLDPVVPFIEMRAFAPEESEQALAWTAEVHAEAEPA